MSDGSPAIFLDRDGTINIDHGYVFKPEQFQFIDGVIAALDALKKMGYMLVIVTNQSGIARGFYTEQEFNKLTEWMDWSLTDRGIQLDAIYYCPHHPEASIEEFRQLCCCRKPQPGMLTAAQKFLQIDMSRSVMVGDRLEDMQAATAAGVGTKVLVRTGKPLSKAAVAAADWLIDSLAFLPAKLKQGE